MIAVTSRIIKTDSNRMSPTDADFSSHDVDAPVRFIRPSHTASARDLKLNNSPETLPLALTDFAQQSQPSTQDKFERLKLVECSSTQSFDLQTTNHPKTAELQSAIESLNTAAAKLQSHRDHVLEQASSEAVKLGIAIAERLLRRTLNTRPESILELVNTSLDSVVCAETARVNLHPADYQLVATHLDDLSRDCSSNIQLAQDSKLARGDCVVETSQGTIDGRLETIFQRISEELLDD